MDYWKKFYKTNIDFSENQSTFCDFVLKYLKDYPNYKNIIDIGCGNGRDSLYFLKNGFHVTGIDLCKEVCEYIKSKHKITIINDSIITYNYKNYDIYYLRFILHALIYNDILKLINNLSKQINENSLIFIETRSVSGTVFDNKNYSECTFKSGIGDLHNRTLLSQKHLLELFAKYDIYPEYNIDTNNLSIFKNENPYLIRLVLRKVNVENYLQSIITPTLIEKQKNLKEVADNIIDIFNKNNINYVVFFGNLIGLLRHNNIFIPWDDDIDLLVNQQDKDKIINLLHKDHEIVIHQDTLFVIKNGHKIDLFYNHESNKTININEYECKCNYKIPKNYKQYFDNFYKEVDTDIMNYCTIYNHHFNDRWTSKHMIKITININRANNLINNIIKSLKLS